MPQARQLVLLNPGDTPGAMRPLGVKRDVLKTLEPYNIAIDGSEEGFATAWGPGLRIEFPFVGERDQVTQLMVTLAEEDFAWPVLTRICKDLHWKMMDPESGRTFGG